jgi:predicted nucleotidyltransferase
MSNFQKILDSFSVKDTLNPKVWENPENPGKSVMIPKIRETLLRIAEKFIEYLGEDVFVEDIVLTGSLANYNWSEFSDFDLHVLVDLKQYEDDTDLYKELFNTASKSNSSLKERLNFSICVVWLYVCR